MLPALKRAERGLTGLVLITMVSTIDTRYVHTRYRIYNAH